MALVPYQLQGGAFSVQYRNFGSMYNIVFGAASLYGFCSCEWNV